MKHFDGDLLIDKIIPQLQILYVQPIEGGGYGKFLPVSTFFEGTQVMLKAQACYMWFVSEHFSSRQLSCF